MGYVTEGDCRRVALYLVSDICEPLAMVAIPWGDLALIAVVLTLSAGLWTMSTADRNRPARIAMFVITTSSSVRVLACLGIREE